MKFLHHSVDEPVADHVARHADARREPQSIGAAMAFDHDTVQAEKGGAVIAPGIDPGTQFDQRAAGEQIADCGKQ